MGYTVTPKLGLVMTGGYQTQLSMTTIDGLEYDLDVVPPLPGTNHHHCVAAAP